jgi:thiol-disulfide isomerase/thioredoxin
MKRAFYLAAFLAVVASVWMMFQTSGISTAPESTFVLLDGSKKSTADLKGKVTLVNFWATSCTTCVKEMPHMVQTYEKYKDKGLDFVAVAMSYDPPNYVLNYAQTRNLPFHVALDSRGDVAKSFEDVKLTPTTYVIDKKGNIIKRYVGEPDFAALHQLLEKALAA